MAIFWMPCRCGNAPHRLDLRSSEPGAGHSARSRRVRAHRRCGGVAVDPAPARMTMLRRASGFVCRHAWIAIALFAWAYGVRTSGEAEFLTISVAPFALNLPPQDQYLYSSPFTFFVGSYYQHHGLDYAWAFFVVNALGLAAFFGSLSRLLATERFVNRSAAALVLFTSPLLFVMLSWIGKSDAYLLAFYFMFTLSESRVAQVILAGLMITCHAEMGAVVLGVDWCLTRKRTVA